MYLDEFISQIVCVLPAACVVVLYVCDIYFVYFYIQLTTSLKLKQYNKRAQDSSSKNI